MNFIKSIANPKNIIVFLFLTLFLICCESLLERDISMIEPVAFYKADMLIDDLKNEKNFPREQVVKVEGLIKETNTKNGKFNILIKGYTNQNHYIICEMSDSFENPTLGLIKGDTIAIKGVLKGYLNDVILLNCVMDNTSKNE